MSPEEIDSRLNALRPLREETERLAFELKVAVFSLSGDIQDYIAQQPPKWQKGITGEAYQDLIGDLEYMDTGIPDLLPRLRPRLRIVVEGSSYEGLSRDVVDAHKKRKTRISGD